MMQFKNLVALAMLALWLPVSLHCTLEKVPGMEFLECEADTPADSHCAGDGCDVIESGAYKIQNHRADFAVTLFCPAVLDTTTATEQPAAEFFGVSRQTAAPPELPNCWQFAFRAAAPPRAPSFAS